MSSTHTTSPEIDPSLTAGEIPRNTGEVIAQSPLEYHIPASNTAETPLQATVDFVPAPLDSAPIVEYHDRAAAVVAAEVKGGTPEQMRGYVSEVGNAADAIKRVRHAFADSLANLE
jgi:hypothetical protein